MTDLSQLLEKVRTAEAGSRRLDGDIAQALGLAPDWAANRNFRQPELWSDGRPGLRARTWTAPHLTTSLDAIVALIERELPGWWWLREDGQSIRLVGPDNGDCYPSSVGRHHLVPLAMVAAFLSALISKEKADG